VSDCDRVSGEAHLFS